MGIFRQPPSPFMGGGQPHGPRKLPIAVTAVPANNPPFTVGGPFAIKAATVAIAQPNQWTYSFLGATQPFGSRELQPGLPGQSVNAPLFIHPARRPSQAMLVTIWQPNPWTYSFMGAAQP